jgi:hypothetical protein
MHQLDKDLIYSAYVRSKERGWGRGGRSQSIGASEIGMCARRTWHLKRDTPKDAIFQDSYGAMERGNLVEEFWVRAMRHTFGSRLKGAGNEQRRLPKGYISCTPDGCLTDLPRDFLQPYGVDDIGEDGSILTECKSFDPRKNPTGVQSEHRLQLIVQIGLVRCLTRRKPLFAAIWYTNAAWLDDVRVFIVKYDEDEFRTLEQRAERIMRANSASDLPPEGYIAGGSECEMCPWAGQCGVERRQVPASDKAEIDTSFAGEIAALARNKKTLEAEIDRLGAEMRAVEIDIRSRLRSRDVRRIEADGIKVAWSAVKGRTGWNNAGIRQAAEAAGVDLTPFVTTSEPGDRLTITIRGDGAAKEIRAAKSEQSAS